MSDRRVGFPSSGVVKVAQIDERTPIKIPQALQDSMKLRLRRKLLRSRQFRGVHPPPLPGRALSLDFAPEE